MLDTIREFAAEQLLVSGEGEAIAQHHADYYLHLAEEAEPALQKVEQGDWYQRLELERENLRVAFRWFLAHAETEHALRLGSSLWRFWHRQGDFREWRDWLEGALNQNENVLPIVRARALWGASWLAHHQGDYVHASTGSAENLALARTIGDVIGLRNALTGVGMAAMAQRRFADALAPLQDRLELCRPLGKSWHLASSLLNLGLATMHAGEIPRAVALLDEALELYRDLGDRAFAARTVGYLGYAALHSGDYQRAELHFRDSLREFAEVREPQGIAETLESLAAVYAVTERAQEAARLVGAASALRETIASQPLRFDRETLAPYWHKGRELLGDILWKKPLLVVVR